MLFEGPVKVVSSCQGGLGGALPGAPEDRLRGAGGEGVEGLGRSPGARAGGIPDPVPDQFSKKFPNSVSGQN